MLSIEIKVNGQPVGTVSAYRGNGGQLKCDVGAYEYPYQATFFPITLRGEPKTYSGAVVHSYNDGMEKLAAAILADISENSPPVS